MSSRYLIEMIHLQEIEENFDEQNQKKEAKKEKKKKKKQETTGRKHFKI